MAQRGFRWLDLGKQRQAGEAFLWACELAPDNVAMRRRAASTLREWETRLRAQLREDFPGIIVRFPPRRYPAIPPELERRMIFWEAVERVVADPRFERLYWQPARKQRRMPPIEVNVTT
jgi:hypothetical protein